ncbi:MAG: hypothetical protein KKF27_21465 [Gammaproteobacteria bacterium]|nr:hypothetical protein [Gammaproteobacteria bacterium]
MNIKNALAVSLVILTIGLVFWMFIKPVIIPRNVVDFITDEDLEYMGSRADGVNGYFYFKREVSDWIKTITQLVPLITLVLAYVVKKRK